MTAEESQNLLIRLAKTTDAQAMLDIFAPYVQAGTVSFDYAPPGIEAFREKIVHLQVDYPVFVAEIGKTMVGYCYASRFRAQTAYNWAVETTIYLDQRYHGGGIGRALYEALEDALRRQRVITLYACISAAHAQSIAFHAHLGYQEVARFHAVGYKMGEWLDIVWMEKRIGQIPQVPSPMIPFGRLEGEHFET